MTSLYYATVIEPFVDVDVFLACDIDAYLEVLRGLENGDDVPVPPWERGSVGFCCWTGIERRPDVQVTHRDWPRPLRERPPQVDHGMVPS